jgi:hypothetical protein
LKLELKVDSKLIIVRESVSKRSTVLTSQNKTASAATTGTGGTTGSGGTGETAGLVGNENEHVVVIFENRKEIESVVQM